jgi:hypothetical protein
MRRREFIAGVASAAAWPAVAQQLGLSVVGWLTQNAADARRESAFRQGLMATGFIGAPRNDVSKNRDCCQGETNKLRC